MVASDRTFKFHETKPWKSKVSGLALMADLLHAFRRYVVLPDHADVALALWVIFAHTFNMWSTSPRLCFTSKGPECGKTTALSILTQLVPMALPTVNMTPAALFRIVEKHQPSLMIDEADTFMEGNEEMRGILNSGHTRDTAYVWRCHPETLEPEAFSTWCPMAIAKIGGLPATLETRSIIIPMRQKSKHEHVERLLPSEFVSADALKSKAMRWATDHEETLSDREVDLPEALGSRAGDNWRPLLAIADEIGGPYPKQARKAAIVLSRQGGALSPLDRGAEFVRARYAATKKPVAEFHLHAMLRKLVKAEEVTPLVLDLIRGGRIKKHKVAGDERKLFLPGGV